MTVLDELMSEARARARGLTPSAVAMEDATPQAHRPSLADALRGKERVDVIAEFKRRSPSRGELRPDASVATQVTAYAAGGARAVSVLTEPTRFGGSFEDLRYAHEVVAVPVLMKDFVVSERQVEHAAALGASAVLLIARCLPQARLEELAGACDRAGVTALVECHDAAELRRVLRIETAVLGVNNRDLSTLRVDRARGRALLARIPPDRVAVAESGYSTRSHVAEVEGLADAVLVGTALMRSPDPAAQVRELLA